MKCIKCNTNQASTRWEEELVFCGLCYTKTPYYILNETFLKYEEETKQMQELKYPEAADYPEGFNWFAYDEDGEGWFYKSKAEAKEHCWYSGFFDSTISAEKFSLDKEIPNWKETLREKPEQNTINPNYYKWHPVCEAVKITQEFTTNFGCAINYIWRVASPDARKYDSKEGRIEDLKKAIRHLEFEIERINNEQS